MYASWRLLVMAIPLPMKGKPVMSTDGGDSTYSPGQSAAFHRLQEAKEKIVAQLSQVIVGQTDVIEELLTTEKFYVFHSGNNEAMKASSDRLRKIYDYFKGYDWANFTEEQLYEHWDFIDEMKKGFDDKWVYKEERPKDVWEEVKTTKKKQLSGAEKRARAAKISEQVLKNADAVRVDVDGKEMNKLLEKQARKEGMGERGQEPKAAGGEKPKKAAVPAPAPKKEKPVPFVTRVPLDAREVRKQLSAIVALHETSYAQVIALSELMHETFGRHRIDLNWEEHVDVSATPKSWLSRPASLLPEGTVECIVEWLDHIPKATLTELFEFLVEHGMPGGGKFGRGGEQPYLGVKALLQILLQRVKGAVFTYTKERMHALVTSHVEDFSPLARARAHSLPLSQTTRYPDSTDALCPLLAGLRVLARLWSCSREVRFHG